jgi:hypothetical protein
VRVYGEPDVFPRPLIRTAWPPPLQCQCTWAYSPKVFGTPDKPYVLKVFYGLCPVPGHATRAAVGLSIEWEQQRKEAGSGKKATGKEGGKGQAEGTQARGEDQEGNPAVQRQRKGWHKRAKKVTVRDEFL